MSDKMRSIMLDSDPVARAYSPFARSMVFRGLTEVSSMYIRLAPITNVVADIDAGPP